MEQKAKCSLHFYFPCEYNCESMAVRSFKLEVSENYLKQHLEVSVFCSDWWKGGWVISLITNSNIVQIGGNVRQLEAPLRRTASCCQPYRSPWRLTARAVIENMHECLVLSTEGVHLNQFFFHASSSHYGEKHPE